MRTKLFYVLIVMALMSAALLITNSRFKLISHPKRTAYVPDAAIDEVWPTTSWTTQGPGIDLKGKMFTLSANGGGIRFYPPRYNTNTPDPWSSSTPYKTRTRPYTSTGPYSSSTGPYSTNRPDTSTGPNSTNRPDTSTGPNSTNRPDTSTGPYSTNRPHTTTRYPWTTAPPFRGVSVCLRYLSAYQVNIPSLFTVSPSTRPLTLGVNFPNIYVLPFQYYYSNTYLKPYINFWSNISPEIWNRVCLTVDSVRNVAQVFSGSNMSIRRVLTSTYVWSGEPVIDFPGFDGQLTDVQVWDYPLRYKEVFNYMTRGVYVMYRGSVITWSSISYSLRGNTLLEDIYEKQANQPIGSLQERGRRPKGERKAREFLNVGERSKRNRQRLK
ncbi:uncharacterized protein LOC132976993 isoform X3 [Labrus mixtus]|uniref:uncharacterized protein LOC132976993 isoform X3 n=1 Tax=Labrus mixtus TaxID=508554 RepID=UPI0029C0E0D0|nr:uncharacterized protein LOC132976993 isoform X3 [Labrus mixtus]